MPRILNDAQRERKRELGRIWMAKARAESPEKYRAQGTLLRRKWRENKENLARDNAARARWREKNPNYKHIPADADAVKRIAETRRLYAVRNRARINANMRSWREKNKDKVSFFNARWLAQNPGLAAEHKLRRRTAMAQAVVPGHSKEILAIYAEAARLTKQTGIRYSVDHIWPIRGKTASGFHVPWNLRVIPLIDNIRKSNKIPVAV